MGGGEGCCGGRTPIVPSTVAAEAPPDSRCRCWSRTVVKPQRATRGEGACDNLRWPGIEFARATSSVEARPRETRELVVCHALLPQKPKP